MEQINNWGNNPNIQGHPFEMSGKYKVIAIKLMNISLCNFL